MRKMTGWFLGRVAKGLEWAGYFLEVSIKWTGYFLDKFNYHVFQDPAYRLGQLGSKLEGRGNGNG